MRGKKKRQRCEKGHTRKKAQGESIKEDKEIELLGVFKKRRREGPWTTVGKKAGSKRRTGDPLLTPREQGRNKGTGQILKIGRLDGRPTNGPCPC